MIHKRTLFEHKEFQVYRGPREGTYSSLGVSIQCCKEKLGSHGRLPVAKHSEVGLGMCTRVESQG